MDRLIQRGEIWMYEFKPPDKRRPVLVLSNQMVIRTLNYVMVAPSLLLFTAHQPKLLLESTKA